MKNPRRRLSLAFGLLVIVFAASKPWRSETASLVSLATTNPVLEVDRKPEVAAPLVRPAVNSPVSAEQRQPQQTAQQKAFQALPQTEQESLWCAFASARRAVQPLTDHEASLPHNKGVRYFAQNPGQQLTARFLDGTVRIESGRRGKWAATLSLAGAAKTKPVLTKERVEYRHSNGITEWYENRAEGIEHAFTVSRRPDEASPELRLALALQGVESRPGKGEQTGTITFADPATGAPVLSYGTLKVWDATGRELAAHYETREQGMDIVVADAGAVYPVTIDPLIATQEAKLGPEVTGDGQYEDEFGSSVALDGDTAVIGASADATAGWRGSAYVFTRSGKVWSLQSKLTAKSVILGFGFGVSVALSEDTVLVGTASGSRAFIFIRSGVVWSQQAELSADDIGGDSSFGISVALSGDTAVVGKYAHYTASGLNVGCAYVFTRRASVWSMEARLTPSDAAEGDFFGVSVALDGETLLVGAFRDDTVAGSDAGSAYVFTRSGAVWSEQAKLTANDASPNDTFGMSVALSDDTAFIGAHGDDSAAGVDVGSAYVFARNGSNWDQQAKLIANDAVAKSHFGNSVRLSGDTALVGVYWNFETGDSPTGSAYIFTRNGTAWSQQAKLTSSSTTADSFGVSVAVDGDTLLVGASGDDTTAGYQAGSAYIFTRSDMVWSQQVKITAGDSAANDRFGWSEALSGDTVLVGVPWDHTAAGIEAGSAYFFTRNGTVWIQQTKLTPNDAARYQSFGCSVALSSDTALVGAAGSGGSAGEAYVFTRSGTAWSQQAKLIAQDAGSEDRSHSLWGILESRWRYLETQRW